MPGVVQDRGDQRGPLLRGPGELRVLGGVRRHRVGGRPLRPRDTRRRGLPVGKRGRHDVAGLEVAVGGGELRVPVGVQGDVRRDHRIDLVLGHAQLALPGRGLDLGAQQAPRLVGGDDALEVAHQRQQLAAQLGEVAAGLVLVLQGAAQAEEHHDRRVRVDLDRPALATRPGVHVEAQSLGDAGAAGVAVGELRLVRVGRVGAGLERPEVLAQRLLGRPGAGRVPHDQRGVDADQAAALDVRRQRGRDLVVGAHRAQVDEPGVRVEHRHPGGLLLPPREVDPDVVHGGSLHHHNVARISPTRTPPPSRSSTPVRRTASVSTPGSTVDAAAAQRGGHQHRPHPRGAVVGLEREGAAVGQRDGVAGLGPGLADRAGDGRAAARPRRGPCRRRTPGGARMASATRRASGRAVPAVDAQGEPAERAGQPDQRGGEAAAHRSRRRRPRRPARR